MEQMLIITYTDVDFESQINALMKEGWKMIPTSLSIAGDYCGWRYAVIMEKEKIEYENKNR
jgi:hypothetical protein